MIKIFNLSNQIRILIKLLLLLSGDVHSNPGPFFLSSNRINIIPLNPIPFTISAVPLGPIQGTLSFTSSAGVIVITTPFGSVHTTTHTSNAVDTIVCPFNFNNVLSAWVCSASSPGNVNPALNWNLSVSSAVPSTISDPLNVKVINSSIEPVPTIPTFSAPIDTHIIAPSIFPVTIENSDPIEVSLSIGDTIPVSIINPSVFPVQIENSDPIHVTIPTDTPLPITGIVSIANPIPSLTSTFLNSFKK
jgi:hypothetical protein